MNKNNLPDLFELWDYNNPAETAKVFRDILPDAQASGDLGYHIELLTQLARTHSLQREFAEAHALLDEAEAKLTPDLVIPQIWLCLERGRAFNSSGQAELAIPLFQQAFELGLRMDETADYHTVDAAHMLGIALPSKEGQLAWNLKALDLAKNSLNTRAQKWRGSLLNNTGWTYHDLGKFQQALAIFQEAYSWFKEHAQDKPNQIRIAKWCIGRTYRSLEQYAEALALQEELVAEYDHPDGFVFEEIGECLLALGEKADARSYFTQAHGLLSQIGWVDKARLERLKTLSL